MFDIRRIPVLRALIPFLGGVVSATLHFSDIQIREVLFILLILWVLALIFFQWQGRRPGPGLWLFSLAMFLLFYFTGMGAILLTWPADPELPAGQWVLIRGEIEDEPHPGKNSYSFYMDLYLLGSDDTTRCINTRIRGYLRMQADSILPAAGETWQFMGKLSPVRNSGNPGAPAFRSIMGRKDCWYYFYPSTGRLATRYNFPLPGEGKRVSPALMRQKVSAHWQGGREEISLLKAVCLGDRASLSDEMREHYAAAGGMHLLAVSGLHVGLIWWVLQYMTGWMRIFFRSEKQRTAGVVGILWFYAFLTGFSSSVCRSVTMFTFFSASRMMGQRIHPLNGILVSAFVLLLIDPVRVMDVGFQLSYSAIIGIVCLHPLSKSLIRVKNPVLRWVWEATSVSLAAQLSTAPLIIFYFHQLPLYSILTSLFAVPLLSVLIAIFVCSVPFVFLGIQENLFNFLLVGLARLMNRIMEFLSSLPGAVMDGLQLDGISLALWILLILLLMISFHSRSRVPGILFFFFISAILVWNTSLLINRRSSSELVISHFRAATMISIKDGVKVDHYCWYRDSTSMRYMEEYRDQTWSHRVYENQVIKLGDSMIFAGRASSCVRIAEGVCLLGTYHGSGLVLTGGLKSPAWKTIYMNSYGNQPVRPGFILLSGEPRIGDLPDKEFMQGIELVLDGSNRSWYIDRMVPELDSIHVTERKGAFVKRW